MGGWLSCVLVFGASAAAEQDAPEGELYDGIYDGIYDYEAVADAPIESEVFGPPLTFPTVFGVTNLYGQVNLTYQSFDDGETTTGGIVDNGN